MNKTVYSALAMNRHEKREFLQSCRLVTRITVDDLRGCQRRQKPACAHLSEGAQGILRSCDSLLRPEWLFPGLKDMAPCRTVPRFSGVRLSLA